MRLLLAILGIGLFLATVPAAPVPREERAAPLYYPTAVGTRLIFGSKQTRKRAEVVTAVEVTGGTTVVTVAVETGGQVTSHRKLIQRRDGLFVAEEAGREGPPEWCLLQFPVAVGARWEVDVRSRRRPPVRWTMTARAPEQVRVPAGTYQAVPVDWVASTNPSRVVKHWYAAGVGLVRTECPEYTEELEAVTPGPAR